MTKDDKKLIKGIDNFYELSKKEKEALSRYWNNQLASDINLHRMYGLDVELTFEGISGIYPYQCFKIDKNSLPDRMTKNKIFFFIKEVSHSIEDSNWTTSITGQLVYKGSDYL